MKKIFTILLGSFLMLAFATSCCNGDNSLSARKAKKLVTKELKRLHAFEGYAYLEVGYYECNNEHSRLELRQLAANEVITYSCDRVKQPKRVRKSRRVMRRVYGYSYYDTEYYYVNDTVDRYFVNVALTEKGQKLVVDSLPKPEKNELMADLKIDFKPDLNKFPEAKVDSVEFPDATPSDDTDVSPSVDEDMVEMAPDDDEYEIISSDADGRNAYEIAKAREHKETVIVKSYQTKIVKVRNIRENPMEKTCKVEAIVECTESNAFGRIINGIYEGQRELIERLPFIYYEDRGWQFDADDWIK